MAMHIQVEHGKHGNPENNTYIESINILTHIQMSESLVPPILNPSSLYKEEARRDATRIRIYNMVLQQIYNKIKAVARIPGNEKSLYHVIPEFIPGTPRFNMGDAVLYIVWNLRNLGYSVNYTHPNLLFVSWRAYDDRYQSRDSPWSQVMNTVRHAALTGATEPSTVSPITRSAPAAPPSSDPEIQKRKTALKKTGEFRPGLTVATPSNPSIASALYHGAGSSTTMAPPRLPGQLSDKHVSFV